MTFANEMRDFLSAYQTVSDVRDKKADRTRQAERDTKDDEYRQALLDLKIQEFDLRKQQATLSSQRSAAGSTRAPSRSDMRADERLSWEREDRAAAKREREANALLRGGSSDPNAVYVAPQEDSFWGEDLAFNEGGLVPDEERRSALPLAPMTSPRPAARPTAPTPSTSAAVGPDPALVAEGGRIAGIQPYVPGQPRQAGSSMDSPTAPRGALPVEPVQDGSTQPMPAQSAPTEPTPVNPEASRIVVQKAGEAVDAAAKSFSTDIQRPAAAVGEGSEQKDVDLMTNRGAMTAEEYASVVRTVDPDGRLAPHLKSAAVLSEAYNFFMERNEPEKALNIARQIIVTQKEASQVLGSLALQHIEGGNLQTACRLFNDACNQFPSGHEIIVQPDANTGLSYRVMNNGELVTEGKMNVGQFQEMATGVANGSEFLRQVVQFGQEQSKRPVRLTPEMGQDRAVEARLVFEDAKEALDKALANGVTGSELKAIRDRAQSASSAFTTARDQAIRAGANRVEVNQAISAALDTRLAPIPDDLLEDEPEGGGSGIGAAIMRWATTGPGSTRPSQADTEPESAIPVTPQGNTRPAPAANPEIPTVSSRAEFEKLPSGAVFRAPDGSIKRKP